MEVPVLETDKLLLEPVSSKHLSSRYVDWLNDAEVNAYLELDGNGEAYTIEKLKAYLDEVGKKNILFWAILMKESDLHIGNIKIDPVNRKHGFAEYGIMMGDKSQWGKGLGYEASKAVIDYCFKDLNIRKIMLGVVSQNTAAVRLYERMGFITEGVYKDHFKLPDQTYSDALRMSLFNPAYYQ